jgi:PAS domain S-box-containing protein
MSVCDKAIQYINNLKSQPFGQLQKMKDQDKTKNQLINELVELRQQIIKLRKTENELKQAEELLEKERETFFPILHKAPYGVVMIDKEGCFIYINPSFTHITGYTLGDVLSGKDWFHRGNPFREYREEIINTWKRNVIQEGVDRIFSVICKNGWIKEIEFKPTLLDDVRIIVIFFNITERLLKWYIKRYGEVPPINNNLTGKYIDWETLNYDECPDL